MDLHQITAAQKLGRLKQIDAQQLTGRNADWAPLNAEKAAILATVGLPPLELMGNPWGHDWAVAFADTFPGFDVDTLLVWFQNACAAGAMKGAEEAQAADKGGLVAALGAILKGVKAGVIRCNSLLSEGPGPTPGVTLQEFIENALDDAVAPKAAACDIVDALFGFAAFLTTSETRYTFSARDDASPAVDALRAFAAKRGLSLDPADVANWQAKAPGLSLVGVPSEGAIVVNAEPQP